MRPIPRTFSHIGLSVPDLDAAVRFYTDVFGFYTIMAPTAVTEDDSDIGRMCSDVTSAGWQPLVKSAAGSQEDSPDGSIENT